MGKTTLLILLIGLGTLHSIAQLPCPQDTVEYGGIPAGQYKWSQGLAVIDYCPLPCEYNMYHCWQLRDTLDGPVNIAGNFSFPFGLATILFVNGCNSVLFDTCSEIGHPFVAPFIANVALPANSQVCVFWDSTTTDSVGILVKSEGMGQKYLDSTLYSLDSCGFATAIDRMHQYSPLWWDFRQGRYMDHFEPNGMYKQVANKPESINN